MISLRISLALSILTAILIHGAAAGDQPYTNPVIGNPSSVEREVADPFVLKYNGEYYLYTSGSPIRAFHSTDLVNWDMIGPVLSPSDKPGAWNQTDVWAPEVVYRNGRFYMYYTASRQSNDWRVGEMARRIGVAVSDSPRGPFVDSGQPVTPGWGIDGTVFRDPDSGEEYLFYSYLYEPSFPGAGIVSDRLPEWNRVAGRPSNAVRGSEAWEDKDGDPNNGSLRYTCEAPTVFKRHGLYYLMYSGGSWDLPTYSLGYAVSDTIPEDGIEGRGWLKYVPPVLRSTRFVEAPGHNTVVKAPNNVDDICIYHARVLPFREPSSRLPFADRIYWNHDRIWMRQPSTSDMTPPDRPLFSDLFNRPDGQLGEAWKAEAGAWRVAGGHARQNRPGAGVSRAIPVVEKLTGYVMEINIRAAESNYAVGGAAGVAAYYLDAKNHIDVWLDREKPALLTGGVLGGQPVPEAATPLPRGFRFDVYHQMLVTKNGGVISVAVDGVNLQSRSYDLGGVAGSVAVQTLNTQADFDGFALTSAWEDTFDSPAEGWSESGGTWLVEGGAVHQVAGGSGLTMETKGDAAEDYEFAASVKWRDNESTGSLAGVVAGAAGDRLILSGFTRNIWPLSRFIVRTAVAGKITEAAAVELPRGFDYSVYHTIRVVKQKDGFTFYLDGAETAAVRFEAGAMKPGIFTEGVRAAFDDCSMTRSVVRGNSVLDAGFETAQIGSALESNPWKLSGGALMTGCCGHSGPGSLMTGEGRAAQTVTGLEPGRYTLHAWINGTGEDEAVMEVSEYGGAPLSTTARGKGWSLASLDFTVSNGTAVISFSSRAKPGTESRVRIDDVYLFRQ